MANFGRSALAVLRWSGWRELLARAPLPMLALAASWGVYSFALWFVPVWVAIVTAGAFELVYIGLSVIKLPAHLQRRATTISLGAVFVSMAYNTIDGLYHLRPSLFEDKPLWADISLALLHGVPLALLAYFVADLLLHTSHEVTKAQGGTKSPKSLAMLSGDLPKAELNELGKGELPAVSPGRPATLTLDDLLSAMKRLGPEATRGDLVEALDSSGSVIDRLLGEAIEARAIEKIGRGTYKLVEVTR